MAKVVAKRSTKSVAKAKTSRAKQVVSLEDQMGAPSSVLRFENALIETKLAGNGRVGKRVTTLGGVTITWWTTYDDGTTWRDLLEDLNDGTSQVKPGITIGRDGGLIPPTAKKPQGFWS